MGSPPTIRTTGNCGRDERGNGRELVQFEAHDRATAAKLLAAFVRLRTVSGGSIRAGHVALLPDGGQDGDLCSAFQRQSDFHHSVNLRRFL